MSLPEPYYEKDGITIYNGDCLLILSDLPRVDLVVTDPPYGINTKSDGTRKINPWADISNAAHFYKHWLSLCSGRLRDAGALWTFLSWRTLATYQKAACDISWAIESLLVWDKDWIGPGGTKGLRPSYELVALFCGPDFSIEDRGIPDLRRSPWSSLKPYHPAEKPLDLVSWLLTISGGDLVLDPFMGSGTTLLAAKQQHKRAIGIEIDEKYCKIAVDRLGQGVLPLEDMK